MTAPAQADDGEESSIGERLQQIFTEIAQAAAKSGTSQLANNERLSALVSRGALDGRYIPLDTEIPVNLGHRRSLRVDGVTVVNRGSGGDLHRQIDDLIAALSAFSRSVRNRDLAVLVERASRLHGNASGRQLSSIASSHGFDVSSSTINKIRTGTYEFDPSDETIRAIEYLARAIPSDRVVVSHPCEGVADIRVVGSVADGQSDGDTRGDEQADLADDARGQLDSDHEDVRSSELFERQSDCIGLLLDQVKLLAGVVELVIRHLGSVQDGAK